MIWASRARGCEVFDERVGRSEEWCQENLGWRGSGAQHTLEAAAELTNVHPSNDRKVRTSIDLQGP